MTAEARRECCDTARNERHRYSCRDRGDWVPTPHADPPEGKVLKVIVQGKGAGRLMFDGNSWRLPNGDEHVPPTFWWKEPGP